MCKYGALLFILGVTGCASHHLHGDALTYDQLKAFGVVTFEDAISESNTIRVPYKIEQKSGDSTNVIQFDSKLRNDVIQVSAKRIPISDQPTRHELVVPVEGSLHESYWIEYRNPDGSVQRLQQADLR